MGKRKHLTTPLRVDELGPVCANVAMTAAAARDAIHTLAKSAGFGSSTLVEWSSADAPGAPPDLAPLYYAALLPADAATDMPLGLGDSPSTALTDLLWSLSGPILLHDVMTNESDPAHAEALEDERALTGA